MVNCLHCKIEKALFFSNDLIASLCKKCYMKVWGATHNTFKDKCCDSCERILIDYPDWKKKCLTCFILDN